MLNSNTTNLKNTDNKQTAVQFLQLVVSGKIEEAYQRYVDFGGKHHNPYFPAGFQSLKRGMMENHEQMPNKQIIIKHVLADGDLIAVHSHLVLNAGEAGMIVLHLFRFKGNKIIEMWDIGQLIPADSPNKDGAF